MKILGCVLTIAAVLSACSTMDASREQSATFQSAVYIVGDSAAPVEAMPQADAQPGTPKNEESTIRRLYWFFAGR